MIGSLLERVLRRPGFLLLLLAALVPLVLHAPYWSSLVVFAAVLAILGQSVNLLLGYLGQVSFGHAAFYGLGAYVAGLMAVKLGVDYWLAVPVAVAAAAGVGALVGLASQRLGGAYLAIATLTLAEMFRLIAANWIELTRGPLGVVVLPQKIAPLEAIGIPFDRYYLFIVLFCLALVSLVVERLMTGAVGRSWLAIREAAPLAEAAGIATLRLRVACVTLSGAIAGLAGGLIVPKIFVLSPDLFGVINSATALLVVVLGGKATILGPVVGGLIFAGVPELLRPVADYREVIFALLLLLAVRLMPGGIMGLLGDRLPRRPAASATVGPAPVADSGKVRGARLDIAALSKSFRGLAAVADVSFSAEAGQIVGLIGPNGAGKTTCLNLISGAIAADRGAVELDGKPVRGLTPHEIARLGMVRTFQQTLLCSRLNVVENVLIGTTCVVPLGIGDWLTVGGALRRAEARRLALAEEAMALMGLSDLSEAKAADLPYGAQRRLSVAVALAAGPRILLLDEPAAGLSPAEAADLAAALRRGRERGTTIVIVDHNVQMMSDLCDRLCVLHHGTRLAFGTPVEVLADPAVVSAYLGAAPAVETA